MASSYLPGQPGYVPRFLPLEMPRLLFTHGYQCEAPGEWDRETPLFIEGGTILIATRNNHWRTSARKKPVISNQCFEQSETIVRWIWTCWSLLEHVRASQFFLFTNRKIQWWFLLGFTELAICLYAVHILWIHSVFSQRNSLGIMSGVLGSMGIEPEKKWDSGKLRSMGRTRNRTPHWLVWSWRKPSFLTQDHRA